LEGNGTDVGRRGWGNRTRILDKPVRLEEQVRTIDPQKVHFLRAGLGERE
jgi:hypothetical protein